MDRRHSARRPWAIVLLILAICCALSYGVASLGRNIFPGSTLGHSQSLSIANIQDLQTTADGFVYYDGSTVSAIDSAGDVRWSYIVGANAGFEATDYGVAAWVGNTVTLIDGKSGSTTYNGSMAENVIGAHIGDKYTAILTGEEGNSTIVLMENGGKQISKIVLDNVLAVDYGFFSDGTLLWVMVCDTNGTVPTCNIQTYRPGKEIVGSISDTEQLAYAVMFQSSRVCVVGDVYYKVYDYAGVEDPSMRKLVYGWYLTAADTSSNDPLMVFVNDAQCKGESDIQDVRIMRSNLDRVVRFPFGCRRVLAVGNTIYGFASDGHLMIMRTDETSPRAYQLGMTIDEVYGVTRDGVAVLRSGGAICLVDLA